MAYGDFKDFPSRTAFDKVLRDKAFNVAKNSKYSGYQRGFASLLYKFFDKKVVMLQVVLFKMKLCQIKNQLKTCTRQS